MHVHVYVPFGTLVAGVESGLSVQLQLHVPGGDLTEEGCVYNYDNYDGTHYRGTRYRYTCTNGTRYQLVLRTNGTMYLSTIPCRTMQGTRVRTYVPCMGPLVDSQHTKYGTRVHVHMYVPWYVPVATRTMVSLWELRELGKEVQI
jgi:hypothetical protein